MGIFIFYILISSSYSHISLVNWYFSRLKKYYFNEKEREREREIDRVGRDTSIVSNIASVYLLMLYIKIYTAR